MEAAILFYKYPLVHFSYKELTTGIFRERRLHGVHISSPNKLKQVLSQLSRLRIGYIICSSDVGYIIEPTPGICPGSSNVFWSSKRK